ncbi:hypothetical protein FSP39_005588 [Pinctada imbricata]|uniref:CUB domain-containing protein n=1 Tax=Pinctada imbricata TaxID=66713 RepID=A0AA88YUG4_PINIB|nr:hypothetical protein FSP39_005588 [Pinctada imbricata]
METNSNELYINFVSDGAASAHGFSLIFEEVRVACGDTISLTDQLNSATIMSPNYPAAYPHNVDCVWIITVPAAESVQVEFDENFNVEQHTNKLLHSSKKEYYTSKVKECGNDSMQLYAVAKSILFENKEIELPSCANDLELANKFGEYFHAKIQTIRTNLEDLLEQNNQQSDALRADLQFTGYTLQEFHPASDQLCNL